MMDNDLGSSFWNLNYVQTIMAATNKSGKTAETTQKISGIVKEATTKKNQKPNGCLIERGKRDLSVNVC